MLFRSNIGNANKLAFTRALDNLYINVSHILVDGDGTNFNAYCNYDESFPQFTTVINGDDRFYPIAAASIIAKVEHDRYINKLVKENPQFESYGLLRNKGYGTAEHKNAIKTYGLTKYHRKTFCH